MIDVHVHFLHSAEGEYTFKLLEQIVNTAIEKGINEICLLEHTHQYYEFEQVYKPISSFNDYQCKWLSRKMGGTVESYLRFIERAKEQDYPIKIKYGLEACYIPKTEDLLASILSKYEFDFITGAVHYIDNWGFDHKLEFWNNVNVDNAYRRYYEIMSDLIETGLFNGLAHPDSIKCFNKYPSYDLIETYIKIAALLKKYNVYAEQSGGLALNYNFPELGMNSVMLRVFKQGGVKIMTASDAHKPEHTGANIKELQQLVNNVQD